MPELGHAVSTMIRKCPAVGAGEDVLVGIGTNDCATLTGNLLEDEKLLGTVHVVSGASAGVSGNMSVPIQLDL